MWCVSRRKQQRPGIAKNDKNNGTIKTTNKTTMPQSNSQRTTLQTCAPNIRRTTHISQHYTPIITQSTAHQRSIPQATPAHPRPRQSAHNNTTTILHTPVQARQTLSHHAIACMQHRRRAEHSPKACMVQKANEQGTPPPITGRALRPPEGRVRGWWGGESGRGSEQYGGGPQTPAREYGREKAGKRRRR